MPLAEITIGKGRPITFTITYLNAGVGAAACYLYNSQGLSPKEIVGTVTNNGDSQVFDVQEADLTGRLLFIRALVTPLKVPDVGRAQTLVKEPGGSGKNQLNDAELVTDMGKPADLRFAYQFK